MSQSITIQLPDSVFAVLTQEAERAGKPPSLWASELLEQQIAAQPAQQETRSLREQAAAKKDFLNLVGTVDIGHPIGIENEEIDRDLAREYGNAR